MVNCSISRSFEAELAMRCVTQCAGAAADQSERVFHLTRAASGITSKPGDGVIIAAIRLTTANLN